MLRRSVESFAERNPGPGRLRAQRQRGGTLDRETWQAMAGAGWIGVTLGEELGGPGLSERELVVIAEALGRNLAPAPFAALSVLAPSLLAECPPSAERDRLCRGIVDGSVIAPVAWQPPRGNGAELPARAERVAGGWHIAGARAFVDAATAATDFLVLTQVEGGIALFSVAESRPGVGLAFRPGIDGIALATLKLADCRVGDDALLARAPGIEALFARPLARTRLALAAELSGLANRALDIAIEYTKTRIQFGKPIASFQVIQHRLVDMWMQAELASAAVRNAVEAAGRGGSAAARAIFAAKARAADAASMVCRNAVHLHGAMGYTDECDIGLYMKRAVSLGAMLGNADEMRRLFIEAEQAAA